MSIAREQMDFKFERKVTYYPGGGNPESGIVLKNKDLVEPYYSEFALATINGKQYFTVINQGPGLSGQNGIFTAVEYVDMISVLINEDKEYGKVRRLVNFDFKEADTRILGLHAIEDKLVLVTLVNNKLTFRVYDPNFGKLLAELSVPEFDIPNPPERIYYTPYIHENTLSLSFQRLDPSFFQNGILTRPDCFSIVSIKLERDDKANNTDNSSNTDDSGNVDDAVKIELLHCINSFKINDIKLNDMVISNMSAVVPVNNKLVVFAVLRGGQSNKVTANKAGEITTKNEFLYPSHFTIFVFGKSQDSFSIINKSENSFVKSQDSTEMMQQTTKSFSKLLYTGEIICDADEDILLPGNSYNENRNIGLVTVKGAEK